MTDIAPLQIHHDNEVVTENGHKGRFILPANRKGACTTRFVQGRQPIRDFTLKFGDVSDNERRYYAADLQWAPQRAMVGYEQDGRDETRRGRTLAMGTFINFVPSPAGQTISAKGKVPWWEVLMQLNLGPLLPGGRWRSPMVAIGLKTVSGVECMIFEGLRDPPLPADQGVSVNAAPPVPISRRAYKLAWEVVDGRGEAGSFRVWLDGKLVCDYHGLLGYANYSIPYFAYGYYRAPNAEETRTIRYEGLTEGAA